MKPLWPWFHWLPWLRDVADVLFLPWLITSVVVGGLFLATLGELPWYVAGPVAVIGVPVICLKTFYDPPVRNPDDGRDE